MPNSGKPEFGWGGEQIESVAWEKRCTRCGVTALSFAGLARAAMLACNDHSSFAVIAHGPHCHHRADAVRGGAGRHDCKTAVGWQRCAITACCDDTGSACGPQCNAAARYR